jgi:t-SNARE complex subunit (syntaxin)
MLPVSLCVCVCVPVCACVCRCVELREQETSGGTFGFGDDGDSKAVLGDEDALDRGFSAEQEQALEHMNERASEREKEIIKVAQSINELAQLFKELNVLVLEQGTILDRIDYNIEQTVTSQSYGPSNTHTHTQQPPPHTPADTHRHCPVLSLSLCALCVCVCVRVCV